MAALAGAPALARALCETPRRWLVTGSAGFIGSHLVETLLHLGQTVVSVDNFSTGHARNLADVRSRVGEQAWSRHDFLRGDLADSALCRQACDGVELVLHQAALGSVPRSIENPLATHTSNVTAFVNMLDAAREAGVGRFVYASSSSVYGDEPSLPKTEERIGKPLSPYAASKYVDEVYAGVFGRCYGLQTIGLRYFNVFGSRQDPDGPYAAVIPRWVSHMLAGRRCVIHGDGETSRDFCYIDNVVQVNLLAALAQDRAATGRVYNVAVGERTTLNALHELMAEALRRRHPGLKIAPPQHGEFRAGDIRHSLADTSAARQLLGYSPTHTVRAGLDDAIDWYVKALAPAPA